MYLEPWQIFMVGVLVGAVGMILVEVILILTHVKPVRIESVEEESEDERK